MLSFGIWLLFLVMFQPPKQPEKPAPAAGAAVDEKKPAADAGKGAAENVAGKVDDGQQAEKPVAAVAAPAAPVAPGGVPQIAPSTVPTQFVTLGSLDPESGYRMLVTLTNAGAAVHRAEMTSPRFTDQHDWSGYLGELELKDIVGGVQVGVVGPGTPAAKASPEAIKAGDIIVGVGNPQVAAITTKRELEAVLAATTPRQELTLQVKHGNNAAQPRTVRLMRRPLAVLRPEIVNYEMRGAKPPEGFVDPPSFLTSLSTLQSAALKDVDKPKLDKFLAELGTELNEGTWELTAHDEKSATLRRALPELKLELVKRYSLAAAPADQRENRNFKAYHLTLDVEVRNTGDAVVTTSYRIEGPTGMPVEGWWYAHKISQRWFAAAGLRDVVVRFMNGPNLQVDGPLIAKGDVEPFAEGQALAYAGVDGQYFSAVIIPDKPLDESWFDVTEAIVVGPKPDARANLTLTNVTCRMTRIPHTLKAGESLKDSYQVFIGPKRPALLAQYQAGGNPAYSLSDILYYGWPIFGVVAQLMLFILHGLYSVVGNYGIAIIMLTLLVRGAMFPISFKQTRNMARMQVKLKALKNDPEFNRINEKYKNDMQKRSQATQELYRKHGINPMDQVSGCLPVFLQLPVFIGLYRALMVDVELRQSPLFGQAIRWCSNLAAPDMFLNWSSIMPEFISRGEGFFGLGPYLNILPLITVALFLVTQKMAMTPPTNEQEAMQQKMMKYMTIFMGLLFYKVASGLCLYFIVSSLWGIAERKMLPRAQTADAAAAGGPGGFGSGGQRPRDGGPNGSAGPKKSRKEKRKK
jgi:YidC/Oxa1 family membrane protein insertase